MPDNNVILLYKTLKILKILIEISSINIEMTLSKMRKFLEKLYLDIPFLRIYKYYLKSRNNIKLSKSI